MISSMNTPISAMRSSVLRLDVAAHDVANINTPNFAQTRVSQTEQNRGTAITSMQRIASPSPHLSATDFAEEAVEMITAKNELAVNARVLRTQNGMVGELLDILA
jgi:flagellar basal-body rod protein FlgC